MCQILHKIGTTKFDKPLAYWLLPFAEFPTVASSGLKRSALAGILVGSIVAAIALSVLSTVFIMKKKQRKRRTVSRGSCKSIFLFYFALRKTRYINVWCIDRMLSGNLKFFAVLK